MRGQSVPLAVVAKVTGAWVTHDPAVLDATSAHHGWSRETLASRLNWKPESPICVLELESPPLPTTTTANRRRFLRPGHVRRV